MKFTEGQRVRVQTRSHFCDGMMGTVLNPCTLIGTVSVHIDGKPEGDNNGFFESELVAVDSTE